MRYSFTGYTTTTIFLVLLPNGLAVETEAVRWTDSNLCVRPFIMGLGIGLAIGFGLGLGPAIDGGRAQPRPGSRRSAVTQPALGAPHCFYCCEQIKNHSRIDLFGMPLLSE